MKNKELPFQISNMIIDYVAEIAELVGGLSFGNRLFDNPTLCQMNRILTIHSSLAMEQNTLSVEQVTEIINGKQIPASPRDITEVKNAYEIYNYLDELDPYSIDDLLFAQGTMTRGLIDESGVFRSQPTDTVRYGDNSQELDKPPQQISGLVEELLDWIKKSDLHMLIRSCVFHYELEAIQPFVYGNGQIERLWQMLLLSKWNPIFAWLQVESILYTFRQEYFTAINTSNKTGECTVFIEFMLRVIKTSLLETIDMSRETLDKTAIRWSSIEGYLKTHPFIMNADVRKLCGVSAATANRILCGFVEKKGLLKYHEGGHWAYKLF